MQNDIGISPVLLQAINHTLTSSEFENSRNEEAKTPVKHVMIIEADNKKYITQHEVPLPSQV